MRRLDLSQRYRVGADIGGTFTDLIIVDDQTGQFAIGKVLTTPQDPSQAVENALRSTSTLLGAGIGEMRQLIHGTTLVTNAMIERKGAATALLTTAGFRDSIDIGRETRYDLYDLMLQPARPLVPRYLRFDVPQRTFADGSTGQSLDIELVKKLAGELAEHGILAVAICFLHSFSNPAAEQQAAAAIQQVAPQLRVSMSSQVVPEIGEYERASTTVANVYVQELVETYLRRLENRLQQNGFRGSFLLMLSNGGVATVDTAIQFPVRLLESGPAAGALAAAAYGTASGNPNLISFDMGGTTAKICVIEQGEPLLAHDFEVDRVYRFKKGSGLPLKLPVIELIEIGTGGGSIARVDPLGLLKVGPDSAGADPGPVCYGRGGNQPTVTDANLLLGYLDPQYFLGGRMNLQLSACRQALQQTIAEPLGLSLEEAAWGIHQIANENMANAARVHASERGMDPRRFPLFAFGGAGPVHAFRLAHALGSPLVIVPFGAGVMSSVGFLQAPLAFDFVRSCPMPLADFDWQTANQLVQQMENEGRDRLRHSGVTERELTHQRHVEMRYFGQGHQIRVPLPDGRLDAATAERLSVSFQQIYRRLYEREGPPVGIEITNWRVVSAGAKPELRLNMKGQVAPAQTVEQCLKGQREAWFPESQGYQSVPVYDRYLLQPGMTFQGPAIVEERESTFVMGGGAEAAIDPHFNLRVRMETSL